MKRTPGYLLIFSIAFALCLRTLFADQVVSDFGDNGGSNQLRAKLTALIGSGGGTITFVGGPATITLASGLPNITNNVTIDGGNNIIISGLSGARPFIVDASGVLNLRNIILERGYFNGEGGAILNSGSLSLNHTTIRNSYAPGGGGGIATTNAVDIIGCTFASDISGNGAAIYANTATAVITIQNSSFHGNSVSSSDSNAARGGAIYLLGGAAATVTGSDFYMNMALNGGSFAVVGSGSALSLQNSKVRDSKATSLGGGIYSSVGTVGCTNTIVSGNTASIGGGIGNFGGTVNATDSTFSGNKETAGGNGGGGIDNNGSTSVATLTNVTFSGNTAGGGGAGFENAFGATATFTNVTFSGNVAGNTGGEGAGFYNYKSTATFTNVTFFNNSAPSSSTTGAGITNVNDPANHLYLRNVIIANSITGANANFAKAPDTNDSNLSSDNSCNFGAGHDNVNVKLGPLASNGGPTLTHALLAGSPAINTADMAVAPTHDQRNYARVGAPDIGAFEFGLPAPRGDFNGDTYSDYLLFNTINHATAIWRLHGNVLLGGTFGPSLPAGWEVTYVADVNLDGEADYVLFNPTTHRTAVWFLNNNVEIGTSFAPTLPAGWRLIAVADMNNDGQPDFVLFNPTSGQTAAWYLKGTLYAGGATGPILPAGWAVPDAVDFNADGKPDFVLVKASTRQTAIWYLNGVTHTAGVFGPNLPVGWMLEGIADFNGDGKPDYVLFRSATRQTALWYLDGSTFIGTAYGPTLPAHYSLVFP